MKKLFACVLSLFLLSANAFALVLEDLPQEKLHQLLSGKRVGFYIGSFNPIHKGHEQLVENIINQDLVDYCLIYPAWGGDEYKNRTDVNIRLDMLFGLYKDNPGVILTKLTPIQLQKRLTIDARYNISGKPAVESSIAAFNGVLGNWINWLFYNIKRSCNDKNLEQRALDIEQVNQTIPIILKLQLLAPELINKVLS